MVLKLYGFPSLTCTKTVQCVLEELSIPYEVIVVDIFRGEHKTRAYKAKQPFGLVPYIDDDGFVLYESRAICRYLALQYGGIGKLIPDPADVRKTALFEQAASVEEHNFDRAAYGLVHEEHFKNLWGDEGVVSEEILDHYRAALEAKLEGYEAILSKQKYMAGNEFSLVDIFHLFYGSLVDDAGFNYLRTKEYPNIARLGNPAVRMNIEH
uniref:glutathione transferase n=1 Tax=Ganoderma boninense TaxID=34458 RepID=A0A5K1K3Q6_9APHY|nr:N/A [Ganoderma boninense]